MQSRPRYAADVVCAVCCTDQDLNTVYVTARQLRAELRHGLFALQVMLRVFDGAHRAGSWRRLPELQQQFADAPARLFKAELASADGGELVVR